MIRKQSWTDSEFKEAVSASTSVREALRRLGLTGTGGNYHGFRVHAERLGVSTAHFLGKGYLKGKTHNWNVQVIPLKEILDKKTGAIRENLITFVTGDPVLIAVTDDQYKNWKGWKLVARPAVMTRMY